MGPPKAIYARPANRFVAAFFGNPPMNLSPGSHRPGDGTVAVEGDDGTEIVAIPVKLEAPGDVSVGIRPEALEVIPDASGHPSS